MRKNKDKKPYVDDGHTVYDMSGVEGPFWSRKNTTDQDSVDVTKKERRAIIKAAFATYLPILLGVLVCFGIAIVIVMLWLR